MFSSVEVLVYLALLGVLVVWLILPLVPAILLYRLFPNASIRATGVLANFKINATGAFAGYLVLFAAMMPFVNETKNYVGSVLHPYWTLSGRIKIVDKNGTEVHYPKLFQTIKIRTLPEMISFQDPAFLFTVPGGEKGDLPSITVEIPDFGTLLLGRKRSETSSTRQSSLTARLLFARLQLTCQTTLGLNSCRYSH